MTLPRLTAGQEIRDTDGTLLATMLRDIEYGQLISTGDVLLADGSQPVAGDPVPVEFWNALERLGRMDA